MIKKSNKIENEIIYIERTLSTLISLKDKILFLINRLYKNFYDDLENQRTTINNGIPTYDTTFEKDIESNNFLNKYGNKRIKTHIMNHIGWVGMIYTSDYGEISSDPKSDYFNLLTKQFHISSILILNYLKPKLINNKDFVLFSPFIFSKEKLINIITYELSIIDDKDIEHYQRKLVSIFEELSLSIGNYQVWDLINENYRVFETSREFEDVCEHAKYYDEFIEWAKFYGVESRETYSLKEVINEIEKLNLLEIRKNSIKLKNRKKAIEKIKYFKSPLKFRNLILEFFEVNSFILNDLQRKRINRFLNNCLEFNSKYPAVNEYNYETIDFFTKKTFKPFVALLVYLSKKEILDFKNPSTLSKILLQEFKELNKNYIGLSNQLRDVISQELITSSKKELIDIIGFDNPSKIDFFLIN